MANFVLKKKHNLLDSFVLILIAINKKIVGFINWKHTKAL